MSQDARGHRKGRTSYRFVGPVNQDALWRGRVLWEDEDFFRTPLQQPLGLVNNFRMRGDHCRAAEHRGCFAGGTWHAQLGLNASRNARLHARGELRQQWLIYERFRKGLARGACRETRQRCRQDMDPAHAYRDMLARLNLEGALLVLSTCDFE